MTRDYSENDEWSEGTQYLWEANLVRAVSGKRGQMALRDLRNALLALPEKKLIEGALCTINRGPQHEKIDVWSKRDTVTEAVAEKGEGVCAVGAYIWQQNRKKGMSDEEAFAAVPTGHDEHYDMTDTALFGKEAGLTFTLSWELVFKNDDEWKTLTPEQRYDACMAWLDQMIIPTVKL